LTLSMLLALIAFAYPAQAQQFQVLHYFTGGRDGGSPTGALAIDGSRNIYGTAQTGGIMPEGCGTGCGTAFEITRKGSHYTFNVIHQFGEGNDGVGPAAGLVLGTDGSLYGTTVNGGLGVGTVYAFEPPATPCEAILCLWPEGVLHSFQGGPNDGFNPLSIPTLDRSGNLYGTTLYGGVDDEGGTAYELVRSGNDWSATLLHSFIGGNDGELPVGGLIFDMAGNLYGTTARGGSGAGGTVFELTPADGGWNESILYNFNSNNGYGTQPECTLVMDQAENLYGTTSGGGANGTIFELTPSDGGWSISLLYGAPHFSARAGLTKDGAGNFYGVSNSGSAGGHASGNGFVFKLIPSHGVWTLIDLHDFSGGDGANPLGAVVLDTSGNLYGTTSSGGRGSCEGGCGVVWEIRAH
jgi:uncharacterized repeat protein (TIGR03803 family)